MFNFVLCFVFDRLHEKSLRIYIRLRTFHELNHAGINKYIRIVLYLFFSLNIVFVRRAWIFIELENLYAFRCI